MIAYIKHDLTDTIHGVVAHGVNCQGKMGSGVAKDVRAKWPKVYDRYTKLVNACRQEEGGVKQLLGVAQIINVDQSLINNLFVANLFTQEFYGYDGKPYADMEALWRALHTVAEFCRGSELPLYMPKIGCGLGGLDWGLVEQCVIDIQKTYQIQIFVCDL